MAVYRRSSRTRYVLAVLVLAALTLVTIDARGNGSDVLSQLRDKVDDVFSPLQRATHTALQPIGNFLTGALDYGSERAENQRLRQELASVEAQSVQGAAEKQAAEQALSGMNLTFVGGIPIVAAEIIDNGSSNFENTVTINKGTSSGITVGQPVVAAGGLVGTVEQVSSDQSTIVLLTDPTFAVGVRLQGGNIGTAQGVGRTEPMRVSVDTTNQASPKMRVGQVVVTSGLDDEKFPPNIPVGRVSEFSKSPTDPEPDITLLPTINVNEVPYVDVMLWSPQ